MDEVHPAQVPPRALHAVDCRFGFLAAATFTASSSWPPPDAVHTLLHTSSPVSIICPWMCDSITYARRAVTVGSTPRPSRGGRLVIHTRSTTPGPVFVASLSSREPCTTHASRLYEKLVCNCGSSNDDGCSLLSPPFLLPARLSAIVFYRLSLLGLPVIVGVVLGDARGDG